MLITLFPTRWKITSACLFIFVFGNLNLFGKGIDSKLQDSILWLMYDTPQARDTLMSLYDQRLSKCSVPFVEKYVHTSLGQTHIVIWGDTNKPPMIILHGMQANATIWLDIIPFLSKHFCLYAPEIICEGSGKTIPSIFPAKREDYSIWIKETIDSLNLKNFFLAGISLGCIISMDYAMLHPNVLRKLILISPPGGIVKTRFLAILKMMRIAFFSGKKYTQNTLDAIRSPIVKSTPDLYSYFGYVVNHCKQGSPMPWYYKDDELRTIKSETLLIIGSDELFINPKAAFARADKFMPFVHTELIKNAGHYSIGDNPEDISKSIIIFCKDKSAP